ncbi:hypothetical protein ANN_22643 [Periplaneta americana]|uniref:Reverse transcriptase domain-containing protein n=1 Tax=Periplaneta americana TaxID=6978 RepID=A0ABQ8S909_PERAM|nr:hypothetical protein ANN_22643 [Periplaneta americana]
MASLCAGSLKAINGTETITHCPGSDRTSIGEISFSPTSNDSTALVYCRNDHRYASREGRVLGVVSYDGAGLLERIHGLFTADVYEHILANVMIPSARKRYPEGTLFFQQDNHPIHTANRIQRWFTRRRDVDPVDRPPNSPDMNPFQNLWAAVKRILRSNWAEQPPVRTPGELWDRVLDAREMMAKNLDLFHNLVDSMPRRMRADVDAGCETSIFVYTGQISPINSPQMMGNNIFARARQSLFRNALMQYIESLKSTVSELCKLSKSMWNCLPYERFKLLPNFVTPSFLVYTSTGRPNYETLSLQHVPDGKPYYCRCVPVGVMNVRFPSSASPKPRRETEMMMNVGKCNYDGPTPKVARQFSFIWLRKDLGKNLNQVYYYYNNQWRYSPLRTQTDQSAAKLTSTYRSRGERPSNQNVEYSLYCPKYKPRITSYRDLKHIEHEELINDALSLPWTEVWNLPDIDDKIEKFNDLVIQLYDKHAPLKTRRVGRHPTPWMCDAIKLLMTDRDTAYRKYRRSKDELDFNTYKVLRNKCNQAVRNAKLRHAHSLILPSVSAKELWRNLNNLGLTKAKPRVDNINLSLNSLNEHFVTAPSEPLHKQETLEFLRSYPQPVWDKFFFKYINPTDVMKTLRRMKSKAQGIDNINITLLYKIIDVILPTVTHIFNASIMTGSYPSLWKMALVKPLPKSNTPSTVNQYRPISILPTLSKALEHIVHGQLMNYLDEHKLLDDYQSGFRHGHSTSTALLKVTEDIREAMDRGEVTALTLLDFSNAFGSVDIDLLLAKMKALHLSDNTLSWMDSYLRDRQQCVSLDNQFSQWRCTKAECRRAPY